MTTPIVIYKKDTGMIVSSGSMTFVEEFKSQQIYHALAPWGHEIYSLAEMAGNPETQYVERLGDTLIMADRPSLVVHIEDDKSVIEADGIDSITLTGLPDVCEIVVDDPDPYVETQYLEVTGGGFVFTADDPGVYIIEIKQWPFLPFKVEFTAVPPT